MNEPIGQILPGTPFGDELTRLAKESITIVEIGTWKGQGSTLCLSRGLVRSDQRMWTIESDETMWKLAQTFFKDEPRIQFIRGHALDVIGSLPATIDLLLIDGADATGYDELMALKDRCLVIALDDTNCLKNERSRQHLIDEGWKMIFDHPEIRNGCSIFRRLSK